tara:strand:+ start:87 stop:551 length:465 start_codon:yes stop_codon:yes gene_type:complete
MVALISQCFNDQNITQSEKFNNNDSIIIPDDATIDKPGPQKIIEDSKSYPFPPQRTYPDLPKPNDSRLLKKNDSVLNNQLSDLTEYIEYLEKLVVDYKKYIEERFNRINDQKYHVVEGFSLGGKNTNDLLLFIIICVFVLLLIDYIFKMGKSSY